MKSKFPLRIIIIAAIVLILLFPYKTVIVPEWKSKVIDENGNTLSEVRFRQNWHNYTYDIQGAEFSETDEAGFIKFDERAFRLPLIYRVPRAFFAYLLLLAHGSVGNSVSINSASDRCSSLFVYYSETKLIPEQITLRCK